MPEPDETGFDPGEVAAAERLDAEIAEVLAGRAGAGTDTTALWLAATLRTQPPAKLGKDIRASAAPRRVPARRYQRLARLAAAALALALIGQGLGNVLFGEWIARGVGEPFAPHALLEGSWAMAAVGVAVAAGAFRRRFLPVSVGSGVPLGVLLGSHGLTEITTFAYGAALHLTEGVLAVVLLVTWVIGSRYSSAVTAEERV